MKTKSVGSRQLMLIYNPTKVDGASLRDLVIAASAQAGWARPGFHPTTETDPGQGAARDALERKPAAVLVAGGDGTVRAVAEVMAGTGIPFAIIPSGTGNLLARNLGLPLADPEAVLDAVFAGYTQPVDIGWASITRPDGKIEDHAFVVLAGLGLDAHMIANTRPDLKRTFGWLAYVDGAARSLPKAKPFRVYFRDDAEKPSTAKVQSILFANCGALPGGISLIPDAAINDGELDVAIIQPKGVFGWVGVWRKIWWDNSVLRRFRTGRRALRARRSSKSVRYLRTRFAEAQVDNPTPVELDGDGYGEAIELHCRVQANALTMVVPKGHTIVSA
jgi:diacylglycerol kinase (ATP)